MTSTEIAYIAGLIDGEGSIGIYAFNKSKVRPHKTFGLVMTITNTYLPVLLWIRENLGGTLKSAGGLKSRRPCWHLQWYGKKASAVLELTVPYMRIKKRQAELAIAFIEQRKSRARYKWPYLTDEAAANDERIADEVRAINHGVLEAV